jgi:hypothetical protein
MADVSPCVQALPIKPKRVKEFFQPLLVFAGRREVNVLNGS